MGSVVKGVESLFNEVTGKADRERKKEQKRVEAKIAAEEQARLQDIEEREAAQFEEQKQQALIRRKKKRSRAERAKTRGGTLLRDFSESENKTLLGT